MKIVHVLILAILMAGCASLDAKEAVLRLQACAEEYDEISTSSDEYFSNGGCAVESFIKLLDHPDANITYEKYYKCDEESEIASTMGAERLKSFASVTKLINHIKPSEWIYSNHYYTYFPCEMSGVLEIYDESIKFSINLGGHGVFTHNDKQFKFSDPRYQDCYDESEC